MDEAIEQEIQAKGLTAPRITPADVEANIVGEYFFTAADGYTACTGFQVVPTELSLLTFCVLVLRNGFTVTGESACDSPESFDAEIERKIARQNAVAKVWPLMNYELRSILSHPADEEKADAMRLLAEVEPHLDEWNFPVTLQDRITQCCNKYYGDVRPMIG